jgi:hypothetical protein
MPTSAGWAFCDDDTVFVTYWASRERSDNPNDDQSTGHTGHLALAMVPSHSASGAQ